MAEIHSLPEVCMKDVY